MAVGVKEGFRKVLSHVEPWSMTRRPLVKEVCGENRSEKSGKLRANTSWRVLGEAEAVLRRELQAASRRRTGKGRRWLSGEIPAGCISGDIGRKTFWETNYQHLGGHHLRRVHKYRQWAWRTITITQSFLAQPGTPSVSFARSNWGSFSCKPSGGKGKRRKDHPTSRRVRKRTESWGID